MSYIMIYLCSFLNLLFQGLTLMMEDDCKCVLKFCCRYTIVTAEEWAKLMQFYDVDYQITIKRRDADFQTEPSEYKYIF